MLAIDPPRGHLARAMAFLEGGALSNIVLWLLLCVYVLDSFHDLTHTSGEIINTLFLHC
jgi:hypothetical protein